MIHEESLLKMNIIPELVHRQFGDLKKHKNLQFQFRNYPNDWTAIGFWLQIHNNEELNRVVGIFNKGKGIAKRLATAQQKTEKEVEIVDDEWDKEHIDEIEGQS